ncbi:MAG TPA: hypothetical protein VGN18_03280 [Jatrophihabitans sp.]|jgi:hypothetical protein|uniref:hypothetical protein n=1 Tax=Jatrophihabitans sp. TaxID=1932789 RepID=UPI002DFAEB72|nr:hypothetical protein [Jatrophihabitans sp.]
MTPEDRSLDTLATASIDAVDVQVLERLAALWDQVDPVPAGLVERIGFGITLDALHAELAELQIGSLAGVRSAESAATQTVTFSSESLTTMVTISPLGGGSVRIDGWATPGAGLVVELRSIGSSRETTADEDGRFVFDEVPHGMVRFLMRSAEGRGSIHVITPSVDI